MSKLLYVLDAVNLGEGEPEDRERALWAQITMRSVEDREAAKRVLDTFEADCEGISTNVDGENVEPGAG